jgi:hypothetical protein
MTERGLGMTERGGRDDKKGDNKEGDFSLRSK